MIESLEAAPIPEAVALADMVEPLEEGSLFDRLDDEGVLAEPPDDDMVIEIEGELVDPTEVLKKETSLLKEEEKIVAVVDELVVTAALFEAEKVLPDMEGELPSPFRLPEEELMPGTEEEPLKGREVSPVNDAEPPVSPLLL